jgi:hypothetical protein
MGVTREEDFLFVDYGTYTAIYRIEGHQIAYWGEYPSGLVTKAAYDLRGRACAVIFRAHELSTVVYPYGDGFGSIELNLTWGSREFYLSGIPILKIHSEFWS